MIRTSISPNIFQGGYRVNVIPSEARATLDVRTHPDDNPEQLLAEVRKVVNDPAIDVAWGQRDVRPSAGSAELDSEAFTAIEAGIKKHYDTVTLPTMSTGATDMAYLRARASSASASARRPTPRTARRASARTATRNGSSRASCIGSCGSTTTWCSRWRGRAVVESQSDAESQPLAQAHKSQPKPAREAHEPQASSA